MDTGLRSGETESANRFLGMEAKVDGKKEEKHELDHGTDCFWDQNKT